MWPPEVERVAAVFRSTGLDARLEELAAGEDEPPGLLVRVEAFACDGRQVVTLLPADRELDAEKLATAASCSRPHRIDPPALPFSGATVLADQLLLTEPTVWIEAGSPRHVAALSPSQLLELVRARATELAADD